LANQFGDPVQVFVFACLVIFKLNKPYTDILYCCMSCKGMIVCVFGLFRYWRDRYRATI